MTIFCILVFLLFYPARNGCIRANDENSGNDQRDESCRGEVLCTCASTLFTYRLLFTLKFSPNLLSLTVKCTLIYFNALVNKYLKTMSTLLMRCVNTKLQLKK